MNAAQDFVERRQPRWLDRRRCSAVGQCHLRRQIRQRSRRRRHSSGW